MSTEFEYQKRQQSEKDERRRQCKELWDRAGTVALWVAAAIGLGAIIESCIDSKHQLGAIHAQINEMRAEQRPWISFTKDVAVDSVSVDNINHQVDAVVRFELQNTGKGPAYRVYINSEMYVGKSIPHDSMPAWQQAVCHEPTAGLGVTMFPGSLEPVYQTTLHVELSSFTQYPVPMGMPVVAACLVYTDAATGVVHYTPIGLRIFALSRTGQMGAIFLASLPLKGNQLAFRMWMMGNLPPT